MMQQITVASDKLAAQVEALRRLGIFPLVILPIAWARQQDATYAATQMLLVYDAPDPNLSKES